MLHNVALWFSVLQGVAVSCSALWVTIPLTKLAAYLRGSVLQRVAACCSMLQRVAACCSMSQRVAACRSMLQHVAACCSVLQCVAACCSVLQQVYR